MKFTYLYVEIPCTAVSVKSVAVGLSCNKGHFHHRSFVSEFPPRLVRQVIYQSGHIQGRLKRRGVVGAFAPSKPIQGGIAPTNGGDVPYHKATKQGLYCSHRKPCQTFQCDWSYVGQGQSSRNPEIRSTNKTKMKYCKFL